MEKWIVLTVSIVVSLIFGFLIGRNTLKPKGIIHFEPTEDETGEEIVRCVFKLDLDLDQIMAERYILFGVSKDDRVMELMKKKS